ncbi:hypothetical protein IFM89_033258 [Coptis chinensis]|uniref:F-box associated beta-propeller type 3 domain-containing protein n=1 Tax=Coptis chinensis TaxID=261450 RepID=A0A835M5F5_9MAGN|nr:hypothetical protein IFM89_033258 [Coptis chinensis]
MCPINEDPMTTGESLPYEIIADIFTRLPAEYVLLYCQAYRALRPFTANSSFVEMHLQRATPIIAFQWFSRSAIDKSKTICKINLSFTDENAKKIVTKRFEVDLRFGCPKRLCLPHLHSSCNGFLLLRNRLPDTAYFLWNPVIQEQVIVTTPIVTRPSRTECTACGVFFHPTARDYRLLFTYNEGVRIKSMVLSLATKSTRLIPNTVSHPPDIVRPPIVLNGALHWMVDDIYYNSLRGDWPVCSDSIVFFNMNKEEFGTMSHPGDPCPLTGQHYLKGLVEMEEHLCYYDNSSHDELVIWMLDDYEKQGWVKKHVIIIAEMRKSCMVLGVSIRSYREARVQVIHMYGDNLLLRVYYRNLFLYNLTLGTFRRVGKMSADSDSRVRAVGHINSLVSLSSTMMA